VLVTSPAHGTLDLDPDGSFSYLPTQDYFGSDTFTYVASDGTLQSPATTVTLTVRPVNDPPSIAIATARSTCGPDEESVTTGLLVSDVDDLAASLVLTATSSNLELVPAANLVAGGSGATRTLTARTKSRIVGTTVLTARASDGRLSSTVPITLIAAGTGGDTVTGTTGADILIGQNGADVLRGLGGDDLLCGGRGDDVMRGGAGADRFDGALGADVAEDLSAAEQDTVEGRLP